MVTDDFLLCEFKLIYCDEDACFPLPALTFSFSFVCVLVVWVILTPCYAVLCEWCMPESCSAWLSWPYIRPTRAMANHNSHWCLRILTLSYHWIKLFYVASVFRIGGNLTTRTTFTTLHIRKGLKVALVFQYDTLSSLFNSTKRPTFKRLIIY